jgi:type I restriction enzyme S subunit
MMEWIDIRLGDACTKIGSGATPRGGGAVYLDAGPIAFIRSQNIYNEGFSIDGMVYLDEKLAQGLANVQVEDLDVLLNITGDSVARACQVVEEVLPARVNQHVAIIRANQKILWPTYLRYFLVSPAMQAHMLGLAAVGATRNALTKGMIESFSIRCPKEVDDQKAIADVLLSLDKKIAVNRRINQTLEAMAQAIFKSWFVDFEPVKAKIAAIQAGRDPLRAAMSAISGKPEAELDALPPEQYEQLAATAALFPDEMEESELGEVPKGWVVEPLSKVIQLIGGGTPKRSEPDYWGGDVLWFSVKDAPSDGDVWAVDTEEKITSLGLQKSSTKLLPVGTTIISARGTVGKLAMVGKEMAMNQSCYGVTGASGIGNCFNYFNLIEAVEKLKRNTHGAVFDTITQATFETVSCVRPLNEQLEIFEQQVQPLLGEIRANVIQNQTLATLRDTLLPKLLTGELSVTDAMAEAEA